MPQFIAKTLAGLEIELEKELKILGAEDTKVQKRAVIFYGNKELLYKVNYCSRLSLSILKPVFSFKAKTNEQLYNKVLNLDWNKIFSIENTFAINSVVNSKYFNHSKYIALKTKDAIADYFAKKKGERPNVDIKNPDYKINLHINHDLCNISLDSTSHPLFMRGYRQKTGIAPINEVLAAGLIHLSEWDKKSYFLDTMCGSGTIAIEAGMMACNIPASKYRKVPFGFQSWKEYDKNLFEKVKQEANSKIKAITFEIEGRDISGRSISIANYNKDQIIELKNIIRFKQADFFEAPILKDQGTMVFNPPYGERMEIDEIQKFYYNIGETLKNRYKNFNAAFITSFENAHKQIKLKTNKRLDLYNGNLKSKFLIYNLW